MMKKILLPLLLFVSFLCKGQNTHVVPSVSLSDVGRLPLINSAVPAIGLAAPNHVTNYDFNNLVPSGYLIGNAAYGSGGIFGAWLTSILTGDSVEVSAPFGVVIGDSQAEGIPALFGRLDAFNTGTFKYNYADTLGQISYGLISRTRFRWFNHGIGGQTTTQIIARFDRDVLGLTTTLSPARTLSGPASFCVIVAGINDPGQPVPTWVTKQNLTLMASKCAAAGIPCIIVDLPGNPTSGGFYNQFKVGDSINTWLSTGALNSLNVTVIPYHKYIWQDNTKSAPNDGVWNDSAFNSTYIGGPIHANKLGYDSLAGLIFTLAKLPVLRSIIISDSVNPGAGPSYARPTGFTISGVAYTSSKTVDTIPITTPILGDSIWIKITANNGGGTNTGFSHIWWYLSNSQANPTYTRNQTPATNVATYNNWTQPQTFSGYGGTVGGVGNWLTVRSHLFTQAGADNLYTLDFRKDTLDNAGAFTNVKAGDIATNYPILVQALNIGQGGNGFTGGSGSSTAVGPGALTAGTTQSNNAAFGAGLTACTSCSGNTAIHSALTSCTTCTNNTAGGPSAGASIVTASDNALWGNAAGQHTTSGNNSFFGSNSGTTNTSGNFNTGGGYRSLFTNSTGAHCAVWGNGACALSNADFLSALGDNAGAANTTGKWNTYLGGAAGQGNQTGDRGIYIGVDGGLNATACSGCIVVGTSCNFPSATTAGQGNFGNVLFFNNLYNSATSSATPVSNGQAGIGVAVPAARLELAAGTATAGMASLLIDDGVPTTTPVAGQIIVSHGLVIEDSSASHRDTLASRDWARNNIPGGSTPTLQQVLTAGSTLTGANTISTGANNLTISGTSTSTINLWPGKQVSIGSGTQILNIDAGIYYANSGISDANLTIGEGLPFYDLPNITANRTITLPSAATDAGRVILIHTTSTSFTWSFATSVSLPDGTVLTNLKNNTWYAIMSNGSIWLVSAEYNNNLKELHSIFTPTTGGTVTAVNNQNNIVNPSGTLATLTIALPSSPANNDVVKLTFTQAITTLTYSGGTVVGAPLSATLGGQWTLNFDSGTSTWY